MSHIVVAANHLENRVATLLPHAIGGIKHSRYCRGRHSGFAGNVLLGGLVGMGVDAYTGAATDHKPNPVAAVLEPIAPPAPARPPRKPRPPAAPQTGT